MGALTISNLTFREAWRQKIFWMALVLGIAFLILFGIGFHFSLREITQNSREVARGPAALKILTHEVSGLFLILGLFAINFMIVMMSALTSVATISGEISSHTIQTIAAKPIRRWEILIGKLLGQSIMLLVYVVFMAGGLILEVYVMTGYLPPHILAGVALMLLEGLIVFSITFLGGTYVSTLANGVLVFMLYGIAFAGSWVEQIGAALQSETAIQVGIVASLIMPSDAMWRIASDLMQPALVSRIQFPLINLFSKPSPAMIVYAGAYMMVLIALALRQFSKRDL
ncbi:MAG: ABC transporter permease subunit [Anaerolineales bacterium]|nr:MAG: ABC transporter permease subunit [Anaerolineales bacterium]